MAGKTIERTACPPPSAWQALLAGSLSTEVVREMEAHLDHCEACAAGLSSLTPSVPELLPEAARESSAHVADVDIWYLRFRSSFAEPAGELTASAAGS
jgi:hypothetical protein